MGAFEKKRRSYPPKNASLLLLYIFIYIYFNNNNSKQTSKSLNFAESHKLSSKEVWFRGFLAKKRKNTMRFFYLFNFVVHF